MSLPRKVNTPKSQKIQALTELMEIQPAKHSKCFFDVVKLPTASANQSSRRAQPHVMPTRTTCHNICALLNEYILAGRTYRYIFEVKFGLIKKYFSFNLNTLWLLVRINHFDGWMYSRSERYCWNLGNMPACGMHVSSRFR